MNSVVELIIIYTFANRDIRRLWEGLLASSTVMKTSSADSRDAWPTSRILPSRCVC